MGLLEGAAATCWHLFVRSTTALLILKIGDLWYVCIRTTCLLVWYDVIQRDKMTFVIDTKRHQHTKFLLPKNKREKKVCVRTYIRPYVRIAQKHKNTRSAVFEPSNGQNERPNIVR